MPTTLQTFDQELVRWGLHHLQGGVLFNSKNEDSTSYNGAPEYFDPYEASAPGAAAAPERFETREEDSSGPLISLSPPVVHSSVNDEAIAHALQELEVEDARSGNNHANTTTVVPSQDRQNPHSHPHPHPHPVHSGSANDESSYGPTAPREDGGRETYGYEEADLIPQFHALSVDERVEESMGPPKQSTGGAGGPTGSQPQGSSSASRGKSGSQHPDSIDYDEYQYGDDDENLNLALALSEDEYRHNQEVAKRLTALDSIKHIPRTNSETIPTMDDASVDHARLSERLILYGLNERQIQGDGNCQFGALSDQMYRTPLHHAPVRKAVVEQLKARGDDYSGYVPMAYNEYLKKMAKNGEWGDHITLQAAADMWGVKIWLITSFKDTCFIEILPQEPKSNRVLYLSFWAEVHYNSIYLEGDMPTTVEVPHKKRHWLLKSIF